MAQHPVRCLILACGNPLRGDDGIGPSLASWAEEHFHERPEIRVLTCLQWTPELAEQIAQADSVLFVDASVRLEPGTIKLLRVAACQGNPGLASHHLDAGQLLSLCREVYSVLPRNALLLTVGIESTELGGSFSKAVGAAIPRAQALLRGTVSRLLGAEAS